MIGPFVELALESSQPLSDISEGTFLTRSNSKVAEFVSYIASRNCGAVNPDVCAVRPGE
jgi:hypothetical protein